MTVSEHYPTEKVEMKLEDHNFPASMAYYFVSQAKEFARQAVEPPLKKNPKYVDAAICRRKCRVVFFFNNNFNLLQQNAGVSTKPPR